MSDNDYLAISGDDEEFGAEEGEFGAEEGEFGAEESDEFGAVARRPAARPAARQPAVSPETMYGFNGTALLAPNVSGTATAAPQRRSRPKRIVLDASVSQYYTVANLTVGVEPIISGSGAVAAAVFASNTTSPPFRSVICEVGMQITATITNMDQANPHWFYSTIVAELLPYGAR